MRKVGFGIIGLGVIAETHFIAIEKNENCEFVAAFDAVPGKAKAFCERHGNGKAYDDLESFLNKFPERLLPFVLTPKQGKDKLVKFDRDTNKTYYIVSFSFNLNGIPDSFYEMMKKNMGASSVDYKSFQMTFYISKKTGLIEKLSQTEVFSASINILTPQVRATTLTKITYYNEKITPIFKN